MPGIVGLGKAAVIAKKELAAEAAHLAALRDKLEQGILARVPIATINGAGALRVANTTSFASVISKPSWILERLDRAGICASAGAACTLPAPRVACADGDGVSERGALASVRFFSAATILRRKSTRSRRLAGDRERSGTNAADVMLGTMDR